MDLYITFNTESGFYETINDVKIEYIISIERKEPNVKLSEYEDGQICNTSVYSISDDNHFSEITVPLDTTKLYFLTCKEHSAGGSYSGGLIIYVAPSLKEILDHAIDYYDASHNITNECELGLCKKNDRSICRKQMLDGLKNNSNYDLECTGLECTIMKLYCIPYIVNKK